MEHHLLGDFTPSNVPDGLQEKIVKDAKIYADVVHAGPMAGTGLSDEAAANKGLSKNHWVWRVLIDGDPVHETWQIRFGVDPKQIPSIGSAQGQYAGSSRSDPDSASDEVFSDVTSCNKPSLVDRDGKPLVVTSSGSGSGHSGGSGSGHSGGSGGSHSSDDSGFSLAGSQVIPPSIRSSDGGVIQQPIEGAPFPGYLGIKVRNRIQASRSTYCTHTFTLAPGTTFGQLLRSLTSRGMEPFYFRKIGVVYLGCRDFVSQAAAAWIADKIMLNGIGSETPPQHIFVLLGWRYTRPLVSGNLSDDSDDASTVEVERAIVGRTPNNIDRAIWPQDYIHYENTMLVYNQPADA